MVQHAKDALRPWLESIIEDARMEWLEDLTTLADDAGNYFPDLMLETEEGREVMGHIAMVEARTDRWADSALTVLQLTNSQILSSDDMSSLRRFKVSENYTTTQECVRKLYTGKSSRTPLMGQTGIKKLENDLVFMWRSRLHSDLRIRVFLPFFKKIALFRGHRFLLAVRSKVIHNKIRLGESTRKDNDTEPVMITLSDDIFTPASIHFILGFLYTSTLEFSYRKYDLATAFTIYRGSVYLSLRTLRNLIVAHIVVDMAHGLFHATLSDEEYRSKFGGTWSATISTGCICRNCAHRVPRIFQLSLEEPFKNYTLKRGALRALVGLFGEGWCTKEFASLPSYIVDASISGFQKSITPSDVIPILFAAEKALLKLQMSSESWADGIKTTIISACSLAEDVMCAEPQACFESETWDRAMTRIWPRSTRDQAMLVTRALRRRARPHQALVIYQSIVTLLEKHLQSDSDALGLLDDMKNELRKTIDLSLSYANAGGNAVLPKMNSNQLADYPANSLIKNPHTDSLYSLISTVETLHSQDEPLQFSASISALDLASSIYSSASSRTVSTDYGIYAQRMALSGDSINWPSNQSLLQYY
ncbi:hypothetical protein CPB84DRAFT_1784857 [Gymnopilus junonius]|uniref:BTB domain-containing protein n=1 Tax=Gymnopilus junonius TaxID=109634 RepID=A0A9P5NLC1_GYMJU|nr:hypothetical protein CPB84DRAFT_1784857 [Gymnopilus junonius]